MHPLRWIRTHPFAADTLYGAVLTALGVAGLWLGNATAHERPVVWGIVGNAVVFSTAFILGDNIRRRRQRVTDLEQLAERLQREQFLLAERTVTDERARIARELHDVVAHSMSLMVVQAGGARRLLSTQPDRTAEALAVIEETGRKGLIEMRRLLGVLRTPEPTTTSASGGRPISPPQPALRSLDQLTTTPDLPVVLSVEGAAPPLSATIDLSGYRIVQEALTNVRKHAGPAVAEVRVRYGHDAVEIEVADDGRGAAVPRTGAGHGVMGMQERAALCGGNVRVGPRPGGGWLVETRLPYEPA